ncbi:unnamed protein product [Hapterophycus canaliculatus]
MRSRGFDHAFCRDRCRRRSIPLSSHVFPGGVGRHGVSFVADHCCVFGAVLSPGDYGVRSACHLSGFVSWVAVRISSLRAAGKDLGTVSSPSPFSLKEVLIRCLFRVLPHAREDTRCQALLLDEVGV